MAPNPGGATPEGRPGRAERSLRRAGSEAGSGAAVTGSAQRSSDVEARGSWLRIRLVGSEKAQGRIEWSRLETGSDTTDSNADQHPEVERISKASNGRKRRQRREGTTLAGWKWHATEIRPRHPMIRYRRAGRSRSVVYASPCFGVERSQSSDQEGPGYQVRSGTPARESFKKVLPDSCFHRCREVESITQIRSVVTPMVDALHLQLRKRGEE